MVGWKQVTPPQAWKKFWPSENPAVILIFTTSSNSLQLKSGRKFSKKLEATYLPRGKKTKRKFVPGGLCNFQQLPMLHPVWCKVRDWSWKDSFVSIVTVWDAPFIPCFPAVQMRSRGVKMDCGHLISQTALPHYCDATLHLSKRACGLSLPWAVAQSCHQPGRRTRKTAPTGAFSL